jgi:hypothetical protein
MSHPPLLHASPAAWRTVAVRLLAILFFAGLLYSGYLAYSILHARCEGFSCTYVGVAWLFWAGVVFAPSAILGFLIRNAASLPVAARTILRYALLLHMGIGAVLLGWWLFTSLFK